MATEKNHVTAFEEQREEESTLLKLMQEIAALANEAHSFEDVLRIAVDKICANTKWPLGHVFWLEDRQRLEMVSSGIWHCNTDGEITQFRKATGEMRLVPGEGWLGEMMSGGSGGWRSLTDDPAVERLQAARELGLVSSFTFPVRVEGRVFAVLEFFSSSADEPGEHLLNAMDFVASQLGQVIMREETLHDQMQILVRLRQSETLLAEAQRVAHLGSWQWDTASNDVTWTEELYRIYGVSPDDFEPTYEKWLQMVHPEDRERVRNIVETAYQTQERFEYHHRIVRADGIVRVIHAFGRPVVDQAGATVRMYGTGQDVTDRHQTEEALRRSEKTYRTLARNIPDAIVALYDNELNLILAEGSIVPEAASMLAPGTSLHHILPVSAQEGSMQPFLDALQGTVQAIEREYDGRTYLLHAMPVRDEDGQIFAGIAMAKDVTKRRENERKLEQRAQQLSALHDMGQTIAASLDLEVVFRNILDLLRPLVGAEGAFVLLREGPDTLVFAAASEVGVGNLTGQRVPASRGVASEVLRTGQVQWLHGEETIERVYHELETVAHYHPRAIIAAPMIFQGELIGVMEAVHTRPDAFGEEEKAMMETAANWVAIAIANARQHGRLQQQLHESKGLAAVSRALSETLDLDRILQIIVNAARELIARADWSAFHFLTEAGERRYFEQAVYAGLEEGDERADVAKGAGDSTQFDLEDLLFEALESPSVQLDDSSTLIKHTTDMGTLVAVPVLGREGSLGVLSVQSSAPDSFSDDDRRLLRSLGRQAAMAIENARLFRAQQQARRAADTLRAANVALSQTLDLHTVLQTLLDYARELIGYNYALVLLMQDDGRMRVEASRGFEQDALSQSPLAVERYPALQRLLGDPSTILIQRAGGQNLRLMPLDEKIDGGSWLFAPLMAGERVAGALVLGQQQAVTAQRQGDPGDRHVGYDQRDAMLAEGLAAQATIAVQNARLFAQVQANQQRLRQLSKQVVNAQEDERQRVSRELHDEAGQALTALKISMEMIRASWTDMPEFVDEQMNEAIEMTDQTMEQIRLLAHDLRPPVLDTFGLVTSVEGLARDFGRRTRLTIDLENTPLPVLSDAVSISFYRFVQETLTNVARHANATKVIVVLRHEDGKIMASVKDDGIGFDAEKSMHLAEQRSGIGLVGLRDRFELLNGWLEIDSAPDQGTTVTAYVPYEEDSFVLNEEDL